MKKLTARQLNVAWLALVIVFLFAVVAAVTRTDPPATNAERAYALKETTLCPVCDGQNVLESNAPVSGAIRLQIDELVDEGESDDQIRDRLAVVYGNDVNANPPRTGLASLVWTIPIVAIAGAIGGLAVAFRKWRVGRDSEVTDDDRDLVAAARRADAERELEDPEAI
ncbi:MAG: cytochrome c-type biogenesis protein CcmH [Candidatus Poriferisodalaceae bacterium]|jgi:cytochrome c-type biogenesis protein CcmH